MARRSARSSRISFGPVFLVDGLGKGAATLEGARAPALTTAEIQALRHSHAPQIRPLRQSERRLVASFFECHGGVASVERGYH